MSDLYAPLFRNVLFPAYESVIRRRKTLSYLHEYERNQWSTSDQIQSIQWNKLQRLLEHCWENVPYYRDQWRALGLSSHRDIRTAADYARLPVLGKPEIRKNFEELIAGNYRNKLLYKTTGGSTGEPLRFGYTRESYERRTAIMWRGYGWSGSRLGERTLYLWGAPTDGASRKERWYHAAFNRCMLNAFKMTESQMAEYAEAVDRFRPETIVSYVAPIVKLAEWVTATGRRIHRPKQILGAAEALHDSQRGIIQQAFGCPAYNTYGCREFMLIAAECEQQNGLHINADHLKVELGECMAGIEKGPREVIVTDLHNYGMPLLRYVNGDLATPSKDTCSCGRGLPLLASVDGRKLDALRTADGRYLPGEYIVYAFLKITGIKRYQVVQKHLDTLDIILVRDHDYDGSAVELIRRELGKVAGHAVRLNFQFADNIPLTPTGKLRVTISELDSQISRV